MANHQMKGMDTDQARQVSRKMDQHASAVGDMVGGISQMLGSVQWYGADAKRFMSDWQGSFAPQAQGATASMQDNAVALRKHADRQDAVSS